LFWFLLVLNLLLVVQGVFSLLEGQRYLSFVRESLKRPLKAFTAPVCVICPCKGIDVGLEANLAALLSQDYPDYELVFVIAQREDPAGSFIEGAISLSGMQEKATLVIAGSSSGRGEKINNLLKALSRVSERSHVLVFADSDACPAPDWLDNLVRPLADPQVGACTGYRWYLPVKGGFWSSLLSAWNGSVATTLGDHGRNFAWGGSTAITRDVFDSAGVADAWSKAVSDDYALTRAIQKAALGIRFVPQCLLVTREDASLRSLLEFTTRQVIITRVYRPAAWWVGIISHSLFAVCFFGQIVALAGKVMMQAGGSGPISNVYVMMAASVALIYLLGSLKGVLRVKSAVLALAVYRKDILKSWWMFCLLWPLVSVVFLYNFIRSATTRRITWRGVCYELRSPSETVIVEH
jgi:ceramide glucosyltransferase